MGLLEVFSLALVRVYGLVGEFLDGLILNLKKRLGNWLREVF